jgi:uncharacterized repeat protein (TIGR03803 family)
LLRDSAGDHYGTTAAGGSFDGGTVFKVAADGAETVLHDFGRTDGMNPYARLMMGKHGSLYGTTFNGGAGFGTVFKLSTNGTESVLHAFRKKATWPYGAWPYGGLVEDENGHLYGTTERGGDTESGSEL